MSEMKGLSLDVRGKVNLQLFHCQNVRSTIATFAIAEFSLECVAVIRYNFCTLYLIFSIMSESQEILLQKIKEQGDLVRKLKATKASNDKVST